MKLEDIEKYGVTAQRKRECLFCNEETDSKKVDKGAVGYICGTCVQILINSSQERLLRAYNLATEKGYAGKAKAIQSFMEVESDEPRRPAVKKHGRNSHRERIMRTSRSQKKYDLRIAV